MSRSTWTVKNHGMITVGNKALEDNLGSLIVPGIDAAKEEGELLENLSALWEEANLTKRRKILLSVLAAVYVDTVEEKAIVAIRPKPALRPLFEIATTCEGSDVVLINEPPRLPTELQHAQVSRERIQEAISPIDEDSRLTRINLTGQDAQLM